ncbi:MAG: hypothetical protein GXX79_05240 [Actinomycetales bacterium]|nr:hypothetical protein [Actinomycetales bacterium]
MADNGRPGTPRTAIRLLGALALAATGLAVPAPAVAVEGQRVELRVLVVSEGGSEEAIATRLEAEGVPFTRVDTRDTGRRRITADVLSATVDGVPTARYQAVVLPDADPPALTAEEKTVLADYERTFGIRRVVAFTWPQPAVGLNPPQDPGFAGVLDGMTARVTADGLAGAFGYLGGEVPLVDVDPAVGETYGYLAVPRADDPVAGSSFRTLVGATIPGTDVTGSLLGVHTHDGGREELVVTLSQFSFQQHAALLGHGIITWMTRGVHLGHQRNYLSVHVDDVLSADARWSVSANCTVGEDCPAGEVPADAVQDIRMTPADAVHLASWQRATGFGLDLAFNGYGSDAVAAEQGTDPLLIPLRDSSDYSRWVNHTYAHLFLGCVQDVTVVPWRCETVADGSVRWTPRAGIDSEIWDNVTWAWRSGIGPDARALVTGEHSGLFLRPQQPEDNPELAPVLAARGVTVLASDSSRDPWPRRVGTAVTLPRHPINLFYNVATEVEEVDEYNHLHTSAADGGSGLCETSPATMTCIEPLGTGAYREMIVPAQAAIVLGHVLGNDPRPHFVHQSNLAEDRLLYPLLEEVIGRYRGLLADSAPLTRVSMVAAADELTRRDAWQQRRDEVTAYLLDGVLHLETGASGGTVEVPLTVPEGTTVVTGAGGGETAFGEPYAGSRSAWAAVDTGGLTLRTGGTP